MRLRDFTRPSLAPYTDRFDVPPADGPISVTFLGVATLLLDDGETQLMTDGFFSRPGVLSVGLRRIAPDPERIAACLAAPARPGCGRSRPCTATTTMRSTRRSWPTAREHCWSAASRPRTWAAAAASPTT